MVGVNGKKFPAIRAHMQRNIGDVYSGLDLACDTFPADDAVDPKAYIAAMDTFKPGDVCIILYIYSFLFTCVIYIYIYIDGAQELGRGRAVRLKGSFPQGFKLEGLKIQGFKRLIILDKPKNRKTERPINLVNLRFKRLKTC